MGHGIAQVAAAAGYRVVLRDIDAEAVARGLQAIERNLAKAIQLGKISEEDRDQTLGRIETTTEIKDLAPADLVIEAAPEKLDLKQGLLREVEPMVGPSCILRSTYSASSAT
jgi:3-hydroxybutyryl-CoA dehydrogenase